MRNVPFEYNKSIEGDYKMKFSLNYPYNMRGWTNIKIEASILPQKNTKNTDMIGHHGGQEDHGQQQVKEHTVQ